MLPRKIFAWEEKSKHGKCHICNATLSFRMLLYRRIQKPIKHLRKSFFQKQSTPLFMDAILIGSHKLSLPLKVVTFRLRQKNMSEKFCSRMGPTILFLMEELTASQKMINWKYSYKKP